MNHLWLTLEHRGRTGESAILCTCVLVWGGNMDRGEQGRVRCWRPASYSLLWTERFAPVSTMRYWTASPETPGRPVQFPEAPPVLCSLQEERGVGGYRKRLGMQPMMWQDCRPTQGIEGAPVHGGSIMRIKEKRSNHSAGQQGWVTLRQCEPLQLMGQWRHGNAAWATST